MNPVNQEYILDYLRSNKDFLKAEFSVTKIALFGSFARNEQGPESDIDLLIETEVYALDNLFNLKEHLEKVFDRKVDVAYFDNVRLFYRRYINEDLIYA